MMKKCSLKILSKILSFMLLLSCTAFVSPQVLAEDTQTAQTFRVYPVEDAGIDGKNDGADPKPANTNYGTATTVGISGTYSYGYKRHYMMKFDLSDATRRIKSATLTLTSNGVTAGGKFGVFKSEDDSWQQDTITFNNANKIFFENLNYCIAQIPDFVSFQTKTVDVTGFVRAQADNDRIITLGFREINTGTGSFNPYHVFNTNDSPEEAKRPYLTIEYYGDDEPIGMVSSSFYNANNSDITKKGITTGTVKAQTVLASNVFGADAMPATVIFTLCVGTLDNYRVKQFDIVSKDVVGSTLFETQFNVPNDGKNYFIRVFSWDTMDGQGTYAPSIMFDKTGLH